MLCCLSVNVATDQIHNSWKKFQPPALICEVFSFFNKFLVLFLFFRLNISFIIDTDVVKGFQTPAQASLSWPSFSSDKPVKFPLTHLGNFSIKFFMLENPADVPVVAQIVPFSLYPQAVWDLLADR